MCVVDLVTKACVLVLLPGWVINNNNSNNNSNNNNSNNNSNNNNSNNNNSKIIVRISNNLN